MARKNIEAAMNFDSQFYDEGQKIILISNGALQTVDRSYNQPFKSARTQWDGKTFVLTQVIELQSKPTPEQARVWEDELKEHYRVLDQEMRRLCQENRVANAFYHAEKTCSLVGEPIGNIRSE